MVDTDLLILVAAVEVGLLLCMLLVLVIRSGLVAFREPRRRKRIQEAETELVASVESGSEALVRFPKLHRMDRVEAVFDLLPSLTGKPADRLARIADQNGLATLGYKWCRSRRWGMRVRGVELLAAFGADGPVDYMLRDRRPEVRIRAALWATSRPDPALLEQLCGMLGDPDPGVRFTVMDSLLRVGGAVVDPLQQTIEADPDAETTASALRVASGVGDHRLAGLALQHCRDRRSEVRAAAAATVGSLGGQVATETLAGMLEDPAPGVRASAVDSLRRMNSWLNSPRIARRLADPDWPVRRAAAIALDEFGPVGRLYIRRAARGEEGLASRVASQILGPDPTGIPR